MTSHAHYIVGLAATPSVSANMPGGKKKRTLDICKECNRSARPAITAARLGHAKCLTTAYRELGIFNEQDDYGATPIHYAARNGQLDCLVWLVTRSGLSPNATSRNGATAAHDAAAMGHIDCLKYLLETTRCSAQDKTLEGATVLHMACRFGRLEVVKWLMEYSKSSPSEKGANDVTPVHLCAAKDHLHCLKWLTQHSQYVANEKTVHGATAVYFAAQEGSIECLEWLVEHASGDPYMSATDGMGPIHAAAQAGQVLCLEWLVESAGISPRHKAEDGATPSHFAAASGQVDTLEWILDHGGSLHERDNLGGTPLHDAAEQGQIGTLSTLLKRGGDVTIVDYDGLKPLDLAQDNDHNDCTNLLFKAVKPSLLLSLTPHHSLSRASATTDEEKAHAVKQRDFEDTMMAGISEERKEAMWQSAQQRAPTDMQPGLTLLLEGQVPASSSQFSIDKVLLAPTGSLRHSRHSSASRHSAIGSKRSSTTASEEFDNLTAYKPRPPLTPSLFQQPDLTPTSKKKAKIGDMDLLRRPLPQNMEVSMGHSPIPQRAKFLKKFNLRKKTSSQHPSKEQKRSKKKDKKGKKLAGKENKVVSMETQEVEKPAEEPLAAAEPTQEAIPVDVDQRLTPKQVSSSNESLVDDGSVSPYDVIVEQPMSDLQAEVSKQRGEIKTMTRGSPLITDKVTLPPMETEGISGGRPLTPPPPVVLREKKDKKKKKEKDQRKSSDYKEEAVIKKLRSSGSLLTPDETVTVSFITKTSHIKKPFPVTHHKLLTADDLSSAGSSDEDEPARESFTTPGFDRLNSQNFEGFGEDVRDIDQIRKETEEEWKKSLDGLDDTPKATDTDKKVSQKLEFEQKDDPESPSLSRWRNIHSLNRIDKIENHTDIPATIKENETDTKSIVQYGSSAVYSKLPQEQARDRKSLEVNKIVSSYEDQRDVVAATAPASKTQPLGGIVRSGSVTEKLKLFGGGMAKPAPKEPPRRSKEVPKLDPKAEVGGVIAEERGGDVAKTKSSESPKPETTPGESSLKKKKEKRKSASPIEKISEEPAIETEVKDKVAPLPKIHPGLARRHSQERLRLDGLRPPSEDYDQQSKTTIQSGQHSPPISRMLLQRGKSVESGTMEEKVPSSPSPILRKKSLSSSVYSPLMISSDAKTVQQEKEKSPPKLRPVSSPSPQLTAESLALYMNSANLPHLNHLKERYAKEQNEKAEKMVDALLKEARLGDADVPSEFKGMELREKNQLYIWKQRAGSLHRVASLEAVKFDPKAIFIIMKIGDRGPLLHHVYLWMGGSVSVFAAQSGYQHCQKLVHCLPGRPVLHREFQGHESFSFAEVVGGSSLEVYEKSPPYFNPRINRAKLYRYSTGTSVFTEVTSPLTHKLLTGHSPLVLDTPTRVFLWLPASYWEEEGQQKMAFEIIELFMTSQSYPNWTPVTMVTQFGETAGFSSHFPSWPITDLRLSPRKEELNLPLVRVTEVSYPATGQTKIWRVSGGEKQPLSLDQFGHFQSDLTYLIQYNYQKQSSLYVWMESMLFVWVGGGVGSAEGEVREALNGAKELDTCGKMPVVVVPEGREPDQLLNLFKGRFIVHKTQPSPTATHFYRISGRSALRMKATEVPPSSSSLHSSHSYVLQAEGKIFVWSGQFSSQAERRGALIVARVLDRSSNPTKLAEGLETYDFWSHIGGKGKYRHFSTPEHPDYILPVFYSCVVDQVSGNITFKQTSAFTKESLKTSECYLVAYRDQLFIWLGSQWKKTTAYDVAKRYILQFHSWQTTEDFKVTMAEEGHEGEIFWKWIAGLKNAGSPEAPPPEAVDGDGGEVTWVDDDVIVKEGEDGTLPVLTEEEPQEEESDIALRSPPTSHPLPLTRSQEVAFERVELLQADITAHMQSLEEREEEEEGTDEGVREKQPISPLRTSQAVNELSEMIEGLDIMMAGLRRHSLSDINKTSPTKQLKRLSSSTPNLLQDGTEAAHAITTTEMMEGSMLSIPVPSLGDLMTQSEDNLTESPVVQKRSKRPAPKALGRATLVVPVEVEGRRVCEVRVREQAPIITVMFKVAQVSGVTLTINSALFELSESLRIQRALEDHELIRDVMATWPSKNRPKLLLRDFVTKNTLWGENPPITKHTIASYLRHNKVPDITTILLHSKKGSRLQWKEGNFSLRALGIYHITETKKASAMELSAGLDHNLYTPLPVRGRTISSPTPFCFIMKPANSWKEKDMKLYCVPNLHSMAQWVHTIRLLKHGLQLKGNYIAMRKRLQKRSEQLAKQDEHVHS